MSKYVKIASIEFSSKAEKGSSEANGIILKETNDTLNSLKGKGIDANFKVLDRAETGPDWYPKPDKTDVLSYKKGRDIQSDKVCNVWDVNAKGWRSFRWANIKQIDFSLETQNG